MHRLPSASFVAMLNSNKHAHAVRCKAALLCSMQIAAGFALFLLCADISSKHGDFEGDVIEQGLLKEQETIGRPLCWQGGDVVEQVAEDSR